MGSQGKFEIDTLIVQTNEYGNTINRSRAGGVEVSLLAAPGWLGKRTSGNYKKYFKKMFVSRFRCQNGELCTKRNNSQMCTTIHWIRMSEKDVQYQLLMVVIGVILFVSIEAQKRLRIIFLTRCSGGCFITYIFPSTINQQACCPPNLPFAVHIA